MKIGSLTYPGTIKKFKSGSRYIIIPSHFFKQGMLEDEDVLITIQRIKKEVKKE